MQMLLRFLTCFRPRRRATTIDQIERQLMVISKEVQGASDAADRSKAASDRLEAKLSQVRQDLADLRANSTTMSQEDKDALIAIAFKLDAETSDADAQSADQPND